MVKTGPGIVYLVTNKINGKKYVGITTEGFEKRKKRHYNDVFKNKSNYYFHNSIREHGWDKFQWEKISDVNSWDELCLQEKHYIIIHHSHRSENGYNMTFGGEGPYGYKHTKEAIEKMKKAKQGKKYSKEHCESMSKAQMGHIVTEETREKLRNRIVTIEWRNKLSESKRRNDQQKKLLVGR